MLMHGPGRLKFVCHFTLTLFPFKSSGSQDGIDEIQIWRTADQRDGHSLPGERGLFSLKINSNTFMYYVI